MSEQLAGEGSPSNRWLKSDGLRGAAYDERFERLAAEGNYIHGEADFVMTLGVGSVLDAGCGTGRVGIELHRRGIDVVGVDLDDKMLSAAREKAPDIPWVQGDLSSVNLDRTFDAAVMAGNVMIFVTPGTEQDVLANLVRHLQPGGICVAGFSLLAGQLDCGSYDRHCAAAGLTLAERWSSWDRESFCEADNYAVSVHQLART